MSKPDASSLRRTLEKAVTDAASAEAHLAKAASGATFQRTDGSPYSYKPIDGALRHLRAAASAAGAADLAASILGDADRSTDEELVAAARHYVERTFERPTRGTWSSDPIDQAVGESRWVATLEFAGEIARELRYVDSAAEKRVALEAQKFADLIDAEGITDPLARAAAVVLTDPTLRFALDPQVLEQLQAPFGFSAEYVSAEVQRELDAAQVETRARLQAEATARQERRAVQCAARVDRGRCDKTGRYEVAVEKGSSLGYRFAKDVKIDGPVRICGTHLKSACKDYSERWQPDVLKVVDTKDGSVVYEKGGAKA